LFEKSHAWHVQCTFASRTPGKSLATSAIFRSARGRLVRTAPPWCERTWRLITTDL
jgi:hypothetical protein